ncbi:hypothetical protein EAE96_010275 [Botrytis aclada]|nr:hypothetical protein EAE96_010275 [Botrytis aclada]
MLSRHSQNINRKNGYINFNNISTKRTMNHRIIENNGAASRYSLPSVDHQSLIQTNLTRHKDAFLFVDKKSSNNEETLSNGDGPSAVVKDNLPTNEENLDEEGSDENIQCQECFWDINRASRFVVLHPCNCIFHLGCIKDKFYEDPKCPKCNTDTMRHRRMTPLEGRFVDKPLELEYVKRHIKNDRIYLWVHDSSDQEGHFRVDAWSRRDLIAARRKVYEKNLYCHSVRSGQALDSIEACKQILRNDHDAKGRMRSWIRLEIQALKQMTLVPDCGDSFEDVVITTLQMHNVTDQQKKNKDYALYILSNILDDYTDLFLHSARAYLTSFCQTLEEWNRAVTYPEETPRRYNAATSPPRPGLQRSSGPKFAYLGSNSEDIRSSISAPMISVASLTTAPQPVGHSIDRNVPQATTPSFVAQPIDQSDVPQATTLPSVTHLEHVTRRAKLSSTSSPLKSHQVLDDYSTRCTVTEDGDSLDFPQNKRGRGLLSRVKLWGARAKFSRSQFHSVQLEEANLQVTLAQMEQSAGTLISVDNVDDGQTHGIKDALPTDVGQRGKLSRKFHRISRFVRKSFKKSPKGLDWEKEQDIR